MNLRFETQLRHHIMAGMDVRIESDNDIDNPKTTLYLDYGYKHKEVDLSEYSIYPPQLFISSVEGKIIKAIKELSETR